MESVREYAERVFDNPRDQRILTLGAIMGSHETGEAISLDLQKSGLGNVAAGIADEQARFGVFVQEAMDINESLEEVGIGVN